MTDEPEKKPRVKLLDGSAGEAAAKLLADKQPEPTQRGYRSAYDPYDGGGDEYYGGARLSQRAEVTAYKPPEHTKFTTDRVGQSNFAGTYYFSVTLPESVGASTTRSYQGKTVFTQATLSAHATEEALLDLCASLTAFETQVRDALAKVREAKKEEAITTIANEHDAEIAKAAKRLNAAKPSTREYLDAIDALRDVIENFAKPKPQPKEEPKS